MRSAETTSEYPASSSVQPQRRARISKDVVSSAKPTDICGNLGGFHPPYSEAGSLAALDDAGSTRDQSDVVSRGQNTRK